MNLRTCETLSFVWDLFGHSEGQRILDVRQSEDGPERGSWSLSALGGGNKS